MKIVYLVPRIENCGPINVVLNIVKELLSNTEFSITLISLRDNSDIHSPEHYASEFKKVGVEEIISMGHHKNLFKKGIVLNSLLKNYDVIHSHGFFPDLYSSLFGKNISKLTTAHCIFIDDYRYTYGKTKGLIFALFHHLVYLNSSFDYLVGCSNEVARYLKSTPLIDKNKVISVQNGVDSSTYFQLNPNTKFTNKSKFLESINISNTESKIFVYAGSLTRRKRVPELIKVFSSLKKENDILIILGDGNERQLCENTANGDKNIIFCGFVDNAAFYYQIADFVVSNSSLEGLPMGVLEGLSCGCVGLLSDIPAHREIIKQLPNMAKYLVSTPQDYETLRWSKEAASFLSSKRMAKHYLSLYKQTLDR